MKLGASTWFLSGTMTMLLFNFFYLAYFPETTRIMFWGAVAFLLVETFVIGTVGGLQFFGIGLTDFSIRLIFGVSMMMGMLFQINLVDIPIGIGLANRVLDAFNYQNFFGFGYIVAFILVIITFFSGIIILVGGVD